jgi:hypothetical protein
MKFLRALLKDFVQFYFVPFVAAILPWRLAARWLWWWAKLRRGPFNESARPATSIAPEFIAIQDREHFAASCRVVWLLDACDLFLSVTRWHRRWWPWHVEQVGAWPRDTAFIATGFHHGTGHWVFRSLARGGHDSLLVSGRWDRRDYKGVPLRYWYGRLRGRDVERLGRRPVAMRPGVREKLVASLTAGTPVVGVIDMPPRLAPRGQKPVRLLDRDVSFPDGLLAIAAEVKVPLVPYWVEFDIEHCTRRFCIGQPLDPDDVDATLQKLADILDRQIRRTPEAWYFWPELPTWIEDAKAVRGKDDTTRLGV